MDITSVLQLWISVQSDCQVDETLCIGSPHKNCPNWRDNVMERAMNGVLRDAVGYEVMGVVDGRRQPSAADVASATL